MQHDYSMITLLKHLGAHRKFILRVTMAVAVLSLIISFLLPVYYQSTTIFYAASERLSAPQSVGNTDRDYYIYGTDDDRDRLLSVATSSEVKGYLIDAFDLYQVYDIDSSSRRGPYEVRLQLEDLYTVQKDDLGGIEISVEDTDRYRAANMANAARDKISTVVQNMIKQSQKNMMDNLSANLMTKEGLIEETDQELRKLREQYQIYDTKAQGGLFAELLTETNAGMSQIQGKLALKGSVPRDSIRKWSAVLKGLETKKTELLKDLQLYNSGVASVMNVEQVLARYSSQYNLDRERYNQLLASYTAPFTALHIVEIAGVPVVKSRPKKAIVIIAATLIAAILSTLFVLIRQSLRQVPWREIFAGDAV